MHIYWHTLFGKIHCNSRKAARIHKHFSKIYWALMKQIPLATSLCDIDWWCVYTYIILHTFSALHYVAGVYLTRASIVMKMGVNRQKFFNGNITATIYMLSRNLALLLSVTLEVNHSAVLRFARCASWGTCAILYFLLVFHAFTSFSCGELWGSIYWIYDICH